MLFLALCIYYHFLLFTEKKKRPRLNQRKPQRLSCFSYFNFDKVSHNAPLKAKLDLVMSPDVQTLASRIKETGNGVIHDGRELSLVAFQTHLTRLSDEDDKDEVVTLVGLVKLHLEKDGMLDLSKAS